MIKKMRKEIKKNSKLFLFLTILIAVLGFTKVLALVVSGTGDYCIKFDFDPTDPNIEFEFPVTSVTINGNEWTEANKDESVYCTTDNRWSIVVLAGKNSSYENEWPHLNTPGGFDQVGNIEEIPNPDDDPNIIGDEYKLTMNLTNWEYNGDLNNEPDPIPGFYGINLTTGGPIDNPPQTEVANITITISGDELEYHYVADKPDEPDVSRFKFSINRLHSDALVPFTFGNANYTYNSNPAPNNVTGVTTINPIQYTYDYDGSGYVTFYINAGASDEYTKIEINGVDYSNQAPHTQTQVFEHLIGRASQFEITNVPYNENGYNVVVEGQRLPDEKQVGSFGWSYKRESEPSYNPNEDSIFAHGRLEFVQVKYTDIDNVEHVFDSVYSYNHAKFHGTGEIYEWVDGDKDYQDLRDAWGEALVPYGAELTFRIVPDEGYQLVGLANGSNFFQTTDEVGVYKITFNAEAMGGGAGNFHLGAVFTEVDNEVKTDSSRVANGSINTDYNVANGNLKLEVSDTNVSEGSRTEFENTAAEGGYTVENYLDLSLYNSIYKGGKTDGSGNYESWDTPVNDINNASVTLELTDDMNGKEVAIIHEVHDGNTVLGYDLIETNYNSNNNSITFETDGFSNYAIVTKSGQQSGGDETVTVSFDSRGGTPIDPININKGDRITNPPVPSNGDLPFDGWFEDEDCNSRFDFGTQIFENKILYAKWIENNGGEQQEPEKDANYTVEDNGTTVSFAEESGHSFHLVITDYLKYTKEEVLAASGATSEQYDAIFDGLREAAEAKNGTLIAFYEIEVLDENDNAIHTGSFYISIPITSNMEGYNTFRMYLISDDDFSVESEVVLAKEGNFFKGELNHLSKYILVGSNTTETDSGTNSTTTDNGDTIVDSNSTVVDGGTTTNSTSTITNKTTKESSTPRTSDTVYIWFGLLGISFIGIVLGTLFVLKKRKNETE